jgi:hypothetical protein
MFIAVLRLQADATLGVASEHALKRRWAKTVVVPPVLCVRRARCRLPQVCGVSCFACGALVLADFSFSALRFIVAVIDVLAFALVLDLDVVLAASGDSADDGVALAGACFGPCSAALLE